MSKDLNKCQITGRLGGDPETKYTDIGKPMCRFTVASNRSWRNAEGEQQDATEWFKVVAWDKLAEICAQYLLKGSKVYCEGRLQTRTWDDTTTGEKRYMTEVVLQEMIMLDNKPEAAAALEEDDEFTPDPERVPPRRTQPAQPAPRPPVPQRGTQQPIRPMGRNRVQPQDDDAELF